jgi:hypothetical protein
MEENNDKSFLKMFWKNIMMPIGFWLFLLATLIFGFGLMMTKNSLDTTKIINEDMRQRISVTSGSLNKQTARADSMNKILTSIAKYIPMASSLQYRDSVCSKLPYSPGDVIRMKPDSSKWVIIAVSITGGKWQHKISYLVRDSSRKEISVEPETIY